MTRTVGLAGLGAIGLPLARALDQGIDGLSLVGVAARDMVRGRARLAGFRDPPPIVDFATLAEADIVVEATPAALFERVAMPAIEAGRIFIPASVGALLPRMHLVKRAMQTGARIIVPTGALLGLDAVRAAAEGRVDSITLETRKPPTGLAGAPWLLKHGIDVMDITMPTRVFSGNARDAAAGFPANVNVAAALALAGIGPIRTKVEIWADPSLNRNVHIIHVEAEAARFTMRIENVPSDDNPKTGKITPLSMLACLRGLVSPLKVELILPPVLEGPVYFAAVTLFWLVLLAITRMRHELLLVFCIPAAFVAIVMGFSMGIYAWDRFGTLQALVCPVLAWFGARALARRYRDRDFLIAIYLVWAISLVFALIAVGFPDAA